MAGVEFSDQSHLLRASSSIAREEGDGDVEAQLSRSGSGGGGLRDLLKRLDRGFSRGHSFKRLSKDRDRDRDRERSVVRGDPHHFDVDSAGDVLGGQCATGVGIAAHQLPSRPCH